MLSAQDIAKSGGGWHFENTGASTFQPAVRRAGNSLSLLIAFGPVTVYRRAMHKPSEAGNTTDGKLRNWLHEFKEIYMGDIADDCYDRAMDEILDGQYGEQDGYESFSRYSRGSTRARQRRGYTEPANPPPVCNRCGKTNLKWRITDAGSWQLFETDRRGERNECVAHQCEPTTAADFDDCSDLV